VRVIALSDTHLKPWNLILPPALESALRSADVIIHAGDMACQEAHEMLAGYAPLFAVRGNADEDRLRASLPGSRVVEVGGLKIGVVHGDGLGGTTLMRARAAFTMKAGPRLDCVVFGHSHVTYCERLDGVLYVNPGSATEPRRAPAGSYAVLTLSRQVEAEIVEI
jgi:putative phosphoesterase